MGGMKRGTFKMFGTMVVFGMAAEAAPHLGTTEQCVGTAQEIMLCGPGERVLDRRRDHMPENEYDTFGGSNSGWVASGAVNSITTSTSSSQNPLRHNPGGTFFFGGDR
jgi:hypothetical protein